MFNYLKSIINNIIIIIVFKILLLNNLLKTLIRLYLVNDNVQIFH